MTDELITPYKQTLSNECHSRALDDDVLIVSVITNTVVSTDHDVPFIQATIKKLQMCLTLSVSFKIRVTSRQGWDDLNQLIKISFFTKRII